jgi:aryl-alcohol dehydrogenase-like predicted oxidoreductase/predicted kinase
MRLSTDERRDDARACETIAAAVAAGVTVFDTARAYALGADELGHNERLLARALRRCRGVANPRIVTKGGMARPRGAWVPDGRARVIVEDCHASLAALDGLTIDLYLVHAPDPRVRWSTSMRALARLLDEGLFRHVGLANVTRAQLDEALALVPVTAVQVALSVYDDRPVRGGVVERCLESGVAVIAHSPLGGPRRKAQLARHPVLTEVAERHGATPAEVALAWVLGLSPGVVAIPGARHPDAARSAAGAARLQLDAGERDLVTAAFTPRSAPRPGRRRKPSAGSEVVLVMGIPGAGKSRLAAEYVARGYARLNRDERGGTLRALADELDEQLGSGTPRAVLDNTYLTRAARSYVIDVAQRHGVPTRCIWLDTPLAQAQVNLVERLLDRFGSLPDPAELRRLARREPGVLTPTSQMRAVRELEPPSTDEGFGDVDRAEFVRVAPADRAGGGVFVAAAALADHGWKRTLGAGDLGAPHLVYDWSPDGDVAELAADLALLSAEVSGPVGSSLCAHPGGPPSCWCRPPLPGLPLVFARAHGVDPSRSVLIGARPADRTLATALGARYLSV